MHFNRPINQIPEFLLGYLRFTHTLTLLACGWTTVSDMSCNEVVIPHRMHPMAH